MSVASLSPPTPYTALMSLLSVALSSATAKSNSMILPDACRVNIQPARKACSINAESLLNLSGIHAQFRRFGCAISVVYARERWRFAKQIRPDLDCGKKAIQWEGAVRQGLPNSLGYFILLRACARRLYHMTPAYFASSWLGDCMSRHVMMWSLDCRWYTASCLLPSSRLYIRMCR